MRNVRQMFTRDHRAGAVPARGAADGGGQPRGPVGALAHDRRRAADPDRGAPGAARGGRRRPRRLRRLAEILARELEVVEIGTRIHSQVQSEMDKTQREYYLRQQLKAIQEELGERDPAEAEVEELREQLDALELPELVRKQADRELSRLEKLPPASAEHGVIRTWLEWIAALPWNHSTDDNLDLGHAREVLDADHYDIEKIKDRILEFLAVRKLTHDGGGTSILCFVGPPGRRQDLARALDRARDGPRVRAHQRRRRARRGRDPRPPAHLHRRDAGRDRPRAARRGLREPRVHDRRDRQDGLGLPRRPGQRDARGARPRAELDLPRPLPRRPLRPLARDVHHDGEHARHDPRPAARPDGDHPARRLHGGGEAPDRHSATSCRARSSATGSSARRSRSRRRA